MHCDCSICNYDYEGFDYVNIVIRKARREHVCCECKEIIKVGSNYQYVHGVYDAHWYTYKTCQRCVTIRDDYCSSGFVYGWLYEQIGECLGYEVV